MLTLSLPSPTSFAYPKYQFGQLSSLRRQTEFNRKGFRDYVLANAFNLENEHMLVGLLQQLSIDPSWDVDYVKQYTMFRSYSLCTLFEITSLGRIGSSTDDGFYRENTSEQWCLIEDDQDYSKGFDPTTSTPIVPLYTTRTGHSYKHPLLRMNVATNPPKHLAIVGINLVELAVGWWHYMQDPVNDGTGISSYLAKYPLMNAQLTHNQLSTFNVLYEHIVNGRALKELVHTDQVTFITSNERKLLLEYFEFLVSRLTSNRLTDIGHLMAQLVSIYNHPYSPFVRAGKAGLFAQTSWVWEPAVMKLYSLYLTLAIKGGYQAGDIATAIKRSHNVRVNNYQRIPEKYWREHFIAMANQVNDLNKINL